MFHEIPQSMNFMNHMYHIPPNNELQIYGMGLPAYDKFQVQTQQHLIKKRSTLYHKFKLIIIIINEYPKNHMGKSKILLV
jgi:hypothetical protein